MSRSEHFEVVVVGAGLSSLAATKAYIQIAPETNLIVLDDHKTLGGVWSHDKVYEGLRSNNLRGTLEFPDYPFHDGFGVPHGEHIPGAALHRYFTEYAEHFNVAQRIRFQTKALEAEKLDDGKAAGWKLLVETAGRQYTITADKLIIGTGLTSQPQKMHIKGEEQYDAPFLHAGALAKEAPAIANDPQVERVTVFGGSKYAWDSVYKFASSGKEVDWVIRKTGYGPTWIVKAIANLPILGEIMAEHIVTTRFITWMSPCPFGDLDGSGWWRRLLHGTWLGRKLVASFWQTLGYNMLEEAGFYNHPDLKPLIPDAEFFDISTSLAVMNYPTDILEYVRSGQVKVHRQDITHLSNHAVHLTDGSTFRSDAIVASSGWIYRPGLTFKDRSLHAEIGIPSSDYSPEQKAYWAIHDQRADAEVYRRFPMLKDCKYPSQAQRTTQYAHDKEPQHEPQRFYRNIAPVGLSAKGDRSLAFAGFGANITHSIKAELTGIWIYAHMNGLLDIDPASRPEEVYYETALMQRWSYRRYTYGFGKRYPDFMFDAIAWNDVLLRDLGLSGKRKGSWWKECFEAYTVKDYRGVTEEWMKLKGLKST